VLIENGDIDLDFIKNHAEGFNQYKELVFKKTIGAAAAICGVSVEDIILAARTLEMPKVF
jgi:ferredoxin-nitrate reductase